ncbi:probable mannitol dehydrogenase isoform X1 [Mangifera indica]|uniref:probable mannitol dehydrogenase isoform X1 n=1 Tax=Mangifera indica TaxID=29780 RepID=UPI001CFA8F50|nr:probable mannitol dehydrogenase isoform X1 [Mangifera indica]
MSELQEEQSHQIAFGWAATDSSGILHPFHFTRRVNGQNDITIKILYCGIRHSDLHLIRNDLGISSYPIVPGHEIVGVVTQVGTKVRNFKLGDKAGVGGLIGSCGSCDQCQNDLENYCPKRMHTTTIFDNGGDKKYGGFSDIFVVDQHFAFSIPENLSLEGVAPLLGAGITVFSPMKFYGLDKPGMHVGVVGLGGLGHLAVKFAKAFGMKVTVISTSPSKMREAIQHLKADSFIVSHDLKQMQAAMGTMDGIFDTVYPHHPLMPFLNLLKFNGKLIMLSGPGLEKQTELSIMPLIFERKMIAGSSAGGMKETQDMLTFAAKHNITADVEVISMGYVNKAMDRLAKGDVHYRFVVDIANTVRPPKSIS